MPQTYKIQFKLLVKTVGSNLHFISAQAVSRSSLVRYSTAGTLGEAATEATGGRAVVLTAATGGGVVLTTATGGGAVVLATSA